ncbi:MAG TPA: tRNA glutamyl-Q(34) synthetase GluQRS [Polyangiaceae bacterium]|nr:tRNA glutamyl-Q(34) synthetase GluQRS [Polyangiaceae bacterium]
MDWRAASINSLSKSVPTRTRFAPSPTGDLHLGGAWTALASWVVGRSRGGAVVLRIEDLDTARVVSGAQARIEQDLSWLGLDWDEGPVKQSERTELYEKAVGALAGRGLVYPCDCSRAEIARAASAPHAGEESVYPGFCRDRDPLRPMKRPPALRVRVPGEVVAYEDAVMGRVTQSLATDVGDFVLQRGDGVFAYQLAVVVDDLAMNVTDVVRGADLALSTPRQIWLARALDREPPRYWHVPLVVASDGARLEKRTPRSTIRELQKAGVSKERIVGKLGHELGLAPTDTPTTAAALASLQVDLKIPWRREPWTIPTQW